MDDTNGDFKNKSKYGFDSISSEWKIEMNGKLNGIYYKSLTLLGLVRNFLRTNPLGVISGILILLILGICFVLLHSGDVIEGIQLKFLTPLTMVSMLMFVTNCNGLLQGGGGTPHLGCLHLLYYLRDSVF